MELANGIKQGSRLILRGWDFSPILFERDLKE